MTCSPRDCLIHPVQQRPADRRAV